MPRILLCLLYPTINLVLGQIKDQFPEPQLGGVKAAALLPKEPVTDCIIAQGLAKPGERFIVTPIEDAPDDEVTVFVKVHTAEINIPEEVLEVGGKVTL